MTNVNKAHIPEQLLSAINRFFYRNPPEELTERFWDAARYAMGNKEIDNKTNVERADIISLFKDLHIFSIASAKFYNPANDPEQNDN